MRAFIGFFRDAVNEAFFTFKSMFRLKVSTLSLSFHINDNDEDNLFIFFCCFVVDFVDFVAIR